MRNMRMLIRSVKFKEVVFPGAKRREGINSVRAEHVTPSLLTGDEKEFRSNIYLVSLV